jgi:hypothetical protein
MSKLDRLQYGALVVGLAGLLLGVIGAFFDPAQFFRAWLAAWQFYLGLALGSFVILMIYHLTGGAWGILLRRILETGTRTLRLLALLFIPLCFGLPYLFVWARPEEVEASKALQHKAAYLNVPFFYLRAALYFIVWLMFAFFLNLLSRRQDRTADPDIPPRLARLAGPGLALYGIAIHFASIDWLMSLQTAFHSTIIGPLYASRHLLTALALAIIVLSWVARSSPLQGFLSEEALNDIGNLLFTFLIIWSYMCYFQYMLVWIADLRYEAIWYLPRTRGGWYWVVWALVLFNFAVPFFLLLLRDVKRDLSSLAKVAGLILFMQLVFAYYEVMPTFPDTTVVEHWMDPVMAVGLGGLWLACFVWQLKWLPLVPAHDANEEAALHYRRLDVEESARLEEMAHG